MKVLSLTMISLSAVMLVLSIGNYRAWFFDKPLFYWDAFVKESKSSASPEQIRQARYGLAYSICMKVKKAMAEKKIGNAVILFEPNSYYRDSLHMDLRVPEPAVFYYYTGLRGVWTNSPDVGKANYFVRVNEGEVKLEAIRSSEQLQMILVHYRKFTPIL